MAPRKQVKTFQPPRILKLESQEQRIDWFFELRSIAKGFEIWNAIDPDQPEQDNDKLQPPKVESYTNLKANTFR
jgi:hypothetical protein